MSALLLTLVRVGPWLPVAALFVLFESVPCSVADTTAVSTSAVPDVGRLPTCGRAGGGRLIMRACPEMLGVVVRC